MLTPSRPRGAMSARIARNLILPLFFCLSVLLAADRTDAGDPPAAPTTPTAPAPAPAVSALTLNLAECVHMALERQPRIAAARASLAAAEDGKRALDAMRIPEIVDREIPVRRKQAALGVTAAAAALDQAEREAVYAVTRTYFTVLYAREQERLARSVVDRLSATHEAAQTQLKSGARDVSTSDVNRSLTYLRLAQAKLTQAAQGEKRALAALKEAIGLCTDVVLDVPQSPLPQPDLHPCREEIVAAAQARRGELIQANVFVEATCLEAEAQGTSTHRRMETFAAGSDIHARLIPPGARNNEYRPAGVPPEMPTLLVGTRPERVKHAQSLYARAGAVAETTRNLIALEAEDAFLRWEEASRQVPQAREAAEAGEKLAEDLSKDFTAGLRVKVEDVVGARVLASQARAQYNEYLYQEILALADLERVTAGAFNPGLVEAPVPPASGGSAPSK